MKNIAIILATVVLGMVLHPRWSQAQTIYKWVDNKGTVHYSEDPNVVPERYKDKAQKKDIEEFPPLTFYIPKKPQSYSAEPPSRRTERAMPARRTESESADSGPSPGYIPFEKFKYITQGMTEAEVLGRLGSPTREEESEVKSKGRISGDVSPGGSLSARYKGNSHTVKRYYYIGDRSKGEQTRVITFEKGKVVSYQSISP